MEKNRNLEMVCFENFLWEHHNPAEVLEDWAEKATIGIINLSIECSLDPTEIKLPLSSVVDDYVRQAHEWFRTPPPQSDGIKFCRAFYSGDALTDEELRWVAIHIQNAIIPAF